MGCIPPHTDRCLLPPFWTCHTTQTPLQTFVLHRFWRGALATTTTRGTVFSSHLGCIAAGGAGFSSSWRARRIGCWHVGALLACSSLFSSSWTASSSSCTMLFFCCAFCSHFASILLILASRFTAARSWACTTFRGCVFVIRHVLRRVERPLPGGVLVSWSITRAVTVRVHTDVQILGWAGRGGWQHFFADPTHQENPFDAPLCVGGFQWQHAEMMTTPCPSLLQAPGRRLNFGVALVISSLHMVVGCMVVILGACTPTTQTGRFPGTPSSMTPLRDLADEQGVGGIAIDPPEATAVENLDVEVVHHGCDEDMHLTAVSVVCRSKDVQDHLPLPQKKCQPSVHVVSVLCHECTHLCQECV